MRAITVILWLLWSVFLFAAEILAVVLAPFVVPFADKYSGRLPWAFRWMETHDMPLPGDMNEPQVRWVYERFGWYVSSVHWLIRNRAYRLANVWRADPDKTSHVTKEYGTRDPGKAGKPAWWLATIKDNKGWWFEFRAAVPLKWFYLQLRAGWKIAAYLGGYWPSDPSRSNVGIHVCSVQSRRIGD